MRVIRKLIALIAVLLFPGLAVAGPTVLTLTQGDTVVEYDLDALKAMEPVTFTTTTIWTDGDQTFTGVSLKSFLDAVGISEGTIQATAINDYAVEIPVSDAVEGGPIIAYLRNGSEMSVRDKGPLWVVYPYNSNPDYESEVIYSRSIWQLDRLILDE